MYTGILLAIMTTAAASQGLEDLEDIRRARSTSSTIIQQRIRETGILVQTSQLDARGAPTSKRLDQRESCREARYVYEPFDGDERDASQCGGYFVTSHLFLTAAHCLANSLDPTIFSDLRIGRGYTSPRASIKTFRIGRAVHSPDLGKAEAEADWVLLEVCSKHQPCRKQERLERLVAQWLRRYEPPRPTGTGRQKHGFLISSPLGFHLHVSKGTYEQGSDLVLPRHWMPAWWESSGGPVFAEDGTLVGIQQGAYHSGAPSCTEEADQCTVRFSLPSNMWNSYIPVHAIVESLGRSPVYLDPSNLGDASEFKQRVADSIDGIESPRRPKRLHTLRIDDDPADCCDCALGFDAAPVVRGAGRPT